MFLKHYADIAVRIQTLYFKSVEIKLILLLRSLIHLYNFPIVFYKPLSLLRKELSAVRRSATEVCVEVLFLTLSYLYLARPYFRF